MSKKSGIALFSCKNVMRKKSLPETPAEKNGLVRSPKLIVLNSTPGEPYNRYPPANTIGDNR